MERARRLAQFWSWLPAFRAVGETEHLPTAAELLHLTPPALSRSIRLLEDRLGVALFERRGRRLVLAPRGRVLLEAVRDAMRRIDDAVEAVCGTAMVGEFRIAGPSPFLSIYVLPALARLRVDHPGLVPVLGSMGPRRANTALREGRLDLAILDDPEPAEDLVVERLVRIGYGIYCGPGHPLHGVSEPSLEEILRHPFAAPPGGDDHWPPHLHRSIGIRLGQLHLGLEVCAAGRYLAFLPDAVARTAPQASALRRLPVDVAGEAALYAVRRVPLGGAGPVDVVLAAIRAVVSEQAGAVPR